MVKPLKYDINSNSAFTLLVNDVEAFKILSRSLNAASQYFSLLMVALQSVLIVTLWSKLETV